MYGQVAQKREEAIQACAKLSEFFCETTPVPATATTQTNDGEVTSTINSTSGSAAAVANSAAFGLLGILAEFATHLDAAVTKYDDNRIANKNKKRPKIKTNDEDKRHNRNNHPSSLD